MLSSRVSDRSCSAARRRWAWSRERTKYSSRAKVVIEGPKMFKAKNVTTSQEGMSFAGSGRTPSTAADPATSARYATNQAVAPRGP